MNIVIGIPIRFNDLRNRYQISVALLDRILGANAIPHFIFPQSDIEIAATKCDCLIVSGGDDLNPEYYHESLNDKTVLEDPRIDELDLACITCFEKHQKMILGICRGMQILAHTKGATIAQHIEHHQKVQHELVLHPDSFLNSIMQSKIVNSYHHQALANCPDGYLLSAISLDETIEAIENDMNIGVQWHPELSDNDEILPFFFKRVLQKKIYENQN